MPLKDFAEFLEPLTPVYRGKPYPLPPVGVKDAVPLMHTLEQESDFAVSDEEFERILLGDQLEQMRADNVPAVFVRHALTCALVDFSHGREAAEARYAAGPDLPKAVPPQSGPAEQQPSNRTEEAAPARPGSASSTKTSRPSSAPKAQGRATRSSGTRSSSSGRSSKPASTPSSESTS